MVFTRVAAFVYNLGENKHTQSACTHTKHMYILTDAYIYQYKHSTTHTQTPYHIQEIIHTNTPHIYNIPLLYHPQYLYT